MGEEVKTTEEPEAAHLRGVLRQIHALCEAATHEADPTFRKSHVETLVAIYARCAAGLTRPRTNGPVIDELYGKIAILEAKLVDRGLDREQLALARAERDQALGIIEQLQADNRALRALLARPRPSQSSNPEPRGPAPLDDDYDHRTPNR